MSECEGNVLEKSVTRRQAGGCHEDMRFVCLPSKVITPPGSHGSAGAPTAQAFVSLPRVRCPERGLGAVQQPGQSLKESPANC